MTLDHTTSIKLPAEMFATAREQAKKNGTSFNAVVRRLIAEWLESGGTWQTSRKTAA